MPTLHPGILKSQAKTRLQDAPTTKLVLIHTGVLLSLSLLASAINLYLNDQISSTGGLSGLGTRSLLQSLQTVLQYCATLFTPFWQAGFTLAVLHIARGAVTSEKDLLGGFRRWLPVLSLHMFTMMILFGVVLCCGYLAALIFSFTPFAQPLADAITPMLSSGAVDLSTIPADTLVDAYIPLFIIYGIVLAPILLSVTLGLRLSKYLILDHKMGAFAAIHLSKVAMRGNKLKMLKLDLSFWWYYLTELLLAIVCYLDVILPMLGITLPFNETTAYFTALILYGIGQLGFQLWKKAYVDTTYALAYQELVQTLDFLPNSN